MVTAVGRPLVFQQLPAGRWALDVVSPREKRPARGSRPAGDARRGVPAGRTRPAGSEKTKSDPPLARESSWGTAHQSVATYSVATDTMLAGL